MNKHLDNEISREQKIRIVEDVIYQFNYFEQKEENYAIKIEDVEYEIEDTREQYPETLKESTRIKYKKTDGVASAAIKIIDQLEKKIKRLKRDRDEKLKKYFALKSVINQLRGDEKELIRLKYIDGMRGESLYAALCYTKSGFIHKKNRVLKKIITLIESNELCHIIYKDEF